MKSNQQNELFKVKLDSTTDPKLIDLERIEGSDATQSLEGIYTIKDDKLTICISVGEGVRRAAHRVHRQRRKRLRAGHVRASKVDVTLARRNLTRSVRST